MGPIAVPLGSAAPGGGDAPVSAGFVLRTDRLSFHIGGVVIVDEVSLDIRRGEFVSVIGPNGAGKTSLFNLLSGLYRATGGRIELDGREMTDTPPARRAQAGLGRTFQMSSIFPALTALENVRLAIQMRSAGAGPFGRSRTDPAETARAREALARVGLERRGADRAGALSHADRRKVELAMLVAPEFGVVLLDEPTAGVSAEDIPLLLRVIRFLHREQGRTVLMVEHRMDVVGELSDRIAVMHHGRLLTCASPGQVIADKAVQEAYLGDAL